MTAFTGGHMPALAAEPDTALLGAWSDGDERALDRLIALLSSVTITRDWRLARLRLLRALEGDRS